MKPFSENILREENVVELVGWQSIHPTIKKPMVTGYAHDFPESHLSIGFALIEKPEILGAPTHVHPFDQWIYLFGANPFTEFDADVEFTYDGKILKISYPCCIFIPKGKQHCPLDIKRVGKPIIFADCSITEEASVRPAGGKAAEKGGRPIYKHVSGNKG